MHALRARLPWGFEWNSRMIPPRLCRMTVRRAAMARSGILGINLTLRPESPVKIFPSGLPYVLSLSNGPVLIWSSSTSTCPERAGGAPGHAHGAGLGSCVNCPTKIGPLKMKKFSFRLSPAAPGRFFHRGLSALLRCPPSSSGTVFCLWPGMPG